MGGSTSKPLISPGLFSHSSTAPCSARNITWQYIHTAGRLPPAYAECANAEDVLDAWQCAEGECRPAPGLVFRSEFEYYSWPWNTWDGLGDPMVGRREGKRTVGSAAQLGWRGEGAAGGGGGVGVDWNGTVTMTPTSVDGSAVARIQHHGANNGNSTRSLSDPTTKPIRWNEVAVGAGTIMLLVLALGFVLWFNCRKLCQRRKDAKSRRRAEEREALVGVMDFDIENEEGFEDIALEENEGRAT